MHVSYAIIYMCFIFSRLMSNLQKPQVWLGVIVIRENKVLLGKRKNAHGEGSRWFPWWHLEFNETWEECAIRETREETGIEIDNIHLWWVTNDIFEDEWKHYITIFMTSTYRSWVVQIMEPNKCEKREWYTWDNLPENVFLPIKNLKKTNFTPFEKVY